MVICCLPHRRKTPKVPDSDGSETFLFQGQPIDISADEWGIAVQRKLLQLPERDRDLVVRLSRNTDINNTLDYLTKLYTSNDSIRLLQKLEPTLEKLDGFSQAMKAMVQIGPVSGQVLWGSLQLLLRSALNYNRALEIITDMLNELTNAMPRFLEYLELFPTVQLRRALRGIYDVYIDFCLATLKFISNKPLAGVMRSLRSSVEPDFTKTKERIGYYKAEFESEAQLAATKATTAWQEEIRSRLPLNLFGVSSKRLTSTLKIPRNRLFYGRDDLLKKLHEELHTLDTKETRTLRSYALYGMGGVGKTQIALEYCYRYKQAYSHIFWVHAASDIEILESYSSIAKALGIDNSSGKLQDNAEYVREWLNSSGQNWLVVYDNVESSKIVAPYWPNSDSGYIILCSQKAHFSNLVSLQMKVLPFEVNDGAHMLLQLLGRDDSELEDANAVATELGGLPLAIAHYAGYILRTDSPIVDIMETFTQTGTSAEIWSADSGSSMTLYEKSLDTVWDSALGHLREDSRNLLDILSFFNPDGISEDFIQSEDLIDSLRPYQSKSLILKVVISDLLRRNLIDRDNNKVNGVVLRMHRSLQRGLLHKLSLEGSRRQMIFDIAVSIMRRVFPRRSLVSRSKSNTTSLQQRCLPHIMCLHERLEQFDGSIQGSLEFADLLGDAAAYLFEQCLMAKSPPILLQGEKICEQLVGADDPSPILANIECFLVICDDLRGPVEGASSIKRGLRVVELREKYHASLSPEKLTLEDEVDLGRAWNDVGGSYCNHEDFKNAEFFVTKALDHYLQLGKDEELRFQISNQYHNLGIIRSAQGRESDMMTLFKKAYELTVEELGKDHLYTIRVNAAWAYGLHTFGRHKEALVKHENDLERRLPLVGSKHVEILSSYYWVGTAHFYLSNFELAEEFLLKALDLARTIAWNPPNLARTKCRLALLTKLQRRHERAQKLKSEALAIMPVPELSEASSLEEMMTLYDRKTCVFDGRSEGPFRHCISELPSPS